MQNITLTAIVTSSTTLSNQFKVEREIVENSFDLRFFEKQKKTKNCFNFLKIKYLVDTYYFLIKHVLEF